MAGTGEVRGQWGEQKKCLQTLKLMRFSVSEAATASSRTMEYLDYDLIRRNPKIFVGFSDVTNYHLALTKYCGLVTFHGPMVSSNIVDSFDEETKVSLYETINGDGEIEFKNPKGYEIGVLKEGKAGKLIGGNLSLLSASIGTPYELDTKDSILFIEEVCEPMSKIEKWAYHLRNAGQAERMQRYYSGTVYRCDE